MGGGEIEEIAQSAEKTIKLLKGAWQLSPYFENLL